VSLRSVPAELISREELASRMGVCTKTVERMTADGMPTIRWGRKLVRYDVDAAMAWLVGQDKAA
jgi:phage terminase Nu1 subunit (DNA packaging protein)